MVQRRTISVPDELHERLDRLQDRINVSKVCAQALEREVTMLEGTAATLDVDHEVEQAIARLQTAADVWYRRGHQDGRAWAVRTATRDELLVVRTWPKIPNLKFPVDGLTREDFARREDVFKKNAAIVQWVSADVAEARQRDPETPESDHRDQVKRAADHDAYERGWMTAAKEVADKIAKAIQIGPTPQS
jgi:hypothetical protein